MNLYEKNVCDERYLLELYEKCGQAHTDATTAPSYMMELYVEDCHTEHIATNCTPVAPIVSGEVTEGGCSPSAVESVCAATGETNPACLAQKALCDKTPIIVVQDAATKCPAAVTVCQSSGADSEACNAAKEECVATL